MKRVRVPLIVWSIFLASWGGLCDRIARPADLATASGLPIGRAVFNPVDDDGHDEGTDPLDARLDVLFEDEATEVAEDPCHAPAPLAPDDAALRVPRTIPAPLGIIRSGRPLHSPILRC